MSAASEIRRRLSLAEGVRMRFLTWTDFDAICHVQYLGTMDALIAAGCLTHSMVAIRAARRSKRLPLRDEKNEKFHLSRFPSRKVPERMILTRFKNANTVMELPGVRELFPEGIIPEVRSQSAHADHERQFPEDCNSRRRRAPRPSFLCLVVDNTTGS
jgi:hypothetical protein